MKRIIVAAMVAAVAASLGAGVQGARADSPGPITVTPASWDFGTLALGVTPPTTTLTITNNTGAPLDQIKVDGTADFAGVGSADPSDCQAAATNDNPLADGASCTVTMAAQTATPGDHSLTEPVYGWDGSAWLTGDTVTLHSTVTPVTPALTVTPTSVNFGSYAYGSTTTRTHAFTFTNHSTDPLSTRMTWDRRYFTVVGQTCNAITLAPGASCVATVKPRTRYSGTHRSALTLRGTDDTTGSSVSPVSAWMSEVIGLPRVWVSATSLSARTFYPLVRDGYRDTVRYSFTLNQTGSGTVRVTNRHGLVVRSYRFRGRRSMSVTWGGRTNAGRRVKPGYYRFRVVAHAHGTNTRSAARTTRVRTGWKNVRHTGARYGQSTSSRSKSGACYFKHDGYYNTDLLMDSWGGTCTAHWVVRVPRGAFRVTHRILGIRYPGLDLGGPVTKRAVRTTRSVRFTVTVSDFAAYDVVGVYAKWTTRVRI
jgi:hypothetical protein